MKNTISPGRTVITVDDHVGKLEKSKREIVERLRIVIQEAVPEVEEMMRWGHPYYYDHGMVCSILMAKDHVSLTLAQGVHLTDPEKYLEGYGKRTRHLKIRSLDDIKAPAISSWLRQTLTLNRKNPV